MTTGDTSETTVTPEEAVLLHPTMMREIALLLVEGLVVTGQSDCANNVARLLIDAGILDAMPPDPRVGQVAG